MQLHVDGYDEKHGGYRVLRTYTRRGDKHHFAWFVEEAEAKRFCELAVHLRDADEVEDIKAQQREGEQP